MDARLSRVRSNRDAQAFLFMRLSLSFATDSRFDVLVGRVPCFRLDVSTCSAIGRRWRSDQGCVDDGPFVHHHALGRRERAGRFKDLLCQPFASSTWRSLSSGVASLTLSAIEVDGNRDPRFQHSPAHQGIVETSVANWCSPWSGRNAWSPILIRPTVIHRGVFVC